MFIVRNGSFVNCDFGMERKALIRIGLSAVIAMVCGLVQAEIIANSLIEIADVKVFAIIFGVALALLGCALLWRAWTVRAERVKFAFLAGFSLLVVASGVSCFFVTDLIHGLTPGAKTPLLMLIGMSLSFALTFCLVELLNADLCGRCCACLADDAAGATGGVFTSRKQFAGVFSASLGMGALYGILFGTLDVEMTSAAHNSFETLLLVSMPIGMVFGGIVGAVNQWLREKNPESDEATRWKQQAATKGDYARL
jgi:hypothetical protein